jgi:16S rRNA (uracil1498-N3)-methyltransferase
MHIFFTPDITESFYELSPEEAKHAVKVLRLKTGDRLYLADGKGHRYLSEIETIGGKTCRVNILETEYAEPNDFCVEIAIAPPKTAARLEFMLEKLTELSADKIVLFRSANSERNKVNQERLQKILIAGLKQSQNFYLPKLVSMPTFNEYISESFDGQRFIAHCYENDKKSLKVLAQAGKNIQIMIGPEGDFRPEEIQSALKAGFDEISLTRQRLRTETAALYAAQAVDFINQKTGE